MMQLKVVLTDYSHKAKKYHRRKIGEGGKNGEVI